MPRYAFLPVLVSILSCANARSADDSVDFNRDIRPILSDKCFACHGPDENKRESGLRLDVKESAFGEADSGERAIVPGDLESSELLARLVTDDADLKMPPDETNKHVTAKEVELIRRWIKSGAEWRGHWSFERVQKSAVPMSSGDEWSRNEVDRFILARLNREGLRPNQEARKAILLRRVTFDLTGLPPTLSELDAFLADQSDEAFEKVVDRLLESPRYGEHMARFWLDAARYGDTHGLHLDNHREMWAYRDWVVRAFNDNMPFDQFTIRQLAGDLLEDSTDDDLVATGFNRCHVTTSEGGSIREEVYVRNVVDRVVTTGTVFMGMTFDCTRCHDHKYDPLTMQDFYGMFAFFNSMADDNGKEANPLDRNAKDPAPVLRIQSEEDKRELARLSEEAQKVRAQIATQLSKVKYEAPEGEDAIAEPEPRDIVWIEDAVPSGVKAEGGWMFVDDPVFSGQKSSTRTAEGLSQHFFSGAPQPLTVAPGDKLFAHVYLDPKNPPKEIMLQWNDGSWDHRAYWGGNHIDWGNDKTVSRQRIADLPEVGSWVRLEVAVETVGLKPGAKINGWAFTQFDGTVYWDTAGISTLSADKAAFDSLAAWAAAAKASKSSSLPKNILSIVKLAPQKRNESQRRTLEDYFVEHAYSKTRAVFDPLHKQRDDVQARIERLKKGGATTLIFREQPTPRKAYFLERGEYDRRGDEVKRSTPSVLPPMPADAPLNRLGFAQWLMDPSHPLTARVQVNRLWQQVFGTGLVKTSDDFGSQGEPPSHAKLLDWLAAEFRDEGWDVKRMMKRLVMSATYRQSSRVTPELIDRDPENRLLARGPRFRLDAEMLRDQALAVSGLLNDKMGGPSVKPPQPDGLWFAVGYSGSNTVRFKPDAGNDKVHRRTLYTYIKRTAPPPQMSTLDAPSREACTVRRERTNTPLQALLLLNDPQYFEAAVALADRVLREKSGDAQQRAAYMYRLAAACDCSDTQVEELVGLYKDLKAEYEKQPEAAKSAISVGTFKPTAEHDVAELAAWAVTANLVLNLDEVISKN